MEGMMRGWLETSEVGLNGTPHATDFSAACSHGSQERLR